MRHFPAFLDLAGRIALLVGEGEVIARKAEPLARAGAALRRAARFEPALLDGVAIAIGADAPEADLRALSAEAQRRGIPVNIVDRAELCSFIMPAIVDRDPITVAISTGGAAPTLARMVRQKIEAVLPPRLGALAALAAGFQARIRRALPDVAARRRFLDGALAGKTADLVLAGRDAEAEVAFAQALAQAEAVPLGTVFLVGAGPGAADLLTLRALRLLGEADVIVHDRLVSDEVLDMARRDAERIFVGKARANHCMPQDQINALLVRLARAGRRVVRLKGGDPFIFGRGGEEAAALVEAGIPHEVVPGITAALACAAETGIPLTHRAAARAVTLVTGHTREGRLDLDFTALARPGQTLAVYMGLNTLPALQAGLVEAGLDPSTPAAIVENGGTGRARRCCATVGSIAQSASGLGRGAPALVLIGEVVGLAPPTLDGQHPTGREAVLAADASRSLAKDEPLHWAESGLTVDGSCPRRWARLLKAATRAMVVSVWALLCPPCRSRAAGRAASQQGWRLPVPSVAHPSLTPSRQIAIRKDWLAQRAEEILLPDLPIVDPHHHLWDREGERYLLDDLLRDTGSGHDIRATVFVQCGAMYRPDGPEELRPLGETEFVNGIGAAAASGCYGPTRACAGIVGFADLTLGDAVAPVLDAQMAVAEARFRGVRNRTAWHPSPEVRSNLLGPPPGPLEDPRFIEGARRLASRGLVLDVWAYQTQLPRVAAIARAIPGLTVVVNHCGGPLGVGPFAGRQAERFAAWRHEVLALAALPNTVMKLGGLAMEVAGHDFHLRNLPPSSAELEQAWRPVIHTLIEAFGAGRCMFASNFPVDKGMCGYAVLWNAFKRLSTGAGEEERTALFAGTATRVYRLHDAPGCAALRAYGGASKP